MMRITCVYCIFMRHCAHSSMRSTQQCLCVVVALLVLRCTIIIATRPCSSYMTLLWILMMMRRRRWIRERCGLLEWFQSNVLGSRLAMLETIMVALVHTCSLFFFIFVEMVVELVVEARSCTRSKRTFCSSFLFFSTNEEKSKIIIVVVPVLHEYNSAPPFLFAEVYYIFLLELENAFMVALYFCLTRTI